MSLVNSSLFVEASERVASALADPGAIRIHDVVTVAGTIPVLDNGESLQPLTTAVVDMAALHQSHVPGAETHLRVRNGVADLLQQAAQLLPAGLQIAVVDAWRPLRVQRFMFEYAQRHGANGGGWVADPDDPNLIPPHSTGGAVDVTLAFDGQPLRLGTSPGEYVDESFLCAFEPASSDGTSRILRRMLFSVMTAAGFAPYDQEWWHYSFGDQEWAAYVGVPVARYGSIMEEAS